jgi:calcium-dependent protein kinase
MAPEIFNKPSYTKPVDIWSCAIIMFMMFNEGNHPYYCPGMKTEDFKYKLKNSPFPLLSHTLANNFIQKISKK